MIDEDTYCETVHYSDFMRKKAEKLHKQVECFRSRAKDIHEYIELEKIAVSNAHEQQIQAFEALQEVIDKLLKLNEN